VQRPPRVRTEKTAALLDDELVVAVRKPTRNEHEPSAGDPYLRGDVTLVELPALLLKGGSVGVDRERGPVGGGGPECGALRRPGEVNLGCECTACRGHSPRSKEPYGSDDEKDCLRAARPRRQPVGDYGCVARITFASAAARRGRRSSARGSAWRIGVGTA
jgi:hypothetical protein